MTNIVAVCSHKGGVGKTTSCANIGAGLTKLGFKVLLIDLDPQSNLSQSFGIENEQQFNVMKCMLGEEEVKPITIYEGLDIIPSNIQLVGIESILSGQPGREFVLKEVIEPIKSKYDFILLDTPASLSILTTNALTLANKVFIPIQSQFFSAKGISDIKDLMEIIKKRLNNNLSILGVAITIHDGRTILNRDIASSLKEVLNEEAFDSMVRHNISVAEAPSQGLDIFRYNSNSNGAKDYMKLCEEFVKKVKVVQEV